MKSRYELNRIYIYIFNEFKSIYINYMFNIIIESIP